jgi:hypothetical protein
MASGISAPSSEYISPLDRGVVFDLSEHADALMNYEDIAPRLTMDQNLRIVDYVRSMLRMSYNRISRRHDHWREADRAHDVYVPPDATSFREKAVIADTRAIADTVMTYLMAALAGRNPMFQLEGLNRKSRRASLLLERVLHQHMRRTAGEARIAQLLLDSIRYGFAPTKIVWDAKANHNQIVNFDPRRCFPDPRVNWGDWERMQFIVFTDFCAFNTLLQTGLYPILREKPWLRAKLGPPSRGWEAHRWHREEGRGLSIDPASALHRERAEHAYFTLGDSRVVDEAWIRLSGHEIGIPQIEEIWVVAAILDENICIRFQANPYGRQFPAVIGGLFNDAHKTHGQSLYDIMLPLHDIATWLLRSRIDNVQAALNNLIFVDPTRVSVPDLIDRNPWGVVRTLPGANANEGVYIAQIPDVTRGHWNDIAALSDLKQRVSAASDAQQGMPTSDGIRTATEIARLTQLGSQRLGVLARIMSATTIRPAVRMMVQNIQDTLSFEGSLRIDPTTLPSALAPMVEDGYVDFDVKKDLQGQVDYLVIDGTLPIEPTRSAETWMNILGVMQQTGLNMEYNTGRIAEEAIRSLGISDLDQFKIPKEQLQSGQLSPSQQMSMMQAARGASVMPNEQLARQVEAGNLVPMQTAQRQ